MTDKFVDMEGLNFRLAPDTSSLANRIGILHLGQPVKEIGPALVRDPAIAEKWVEIDAEIGGVTKRGMVKAEINGKSSLRDPVSKMREALVAEAIKEWLRFEQGQGKEHIDPFSDFVGQMWQAIGLDLDGRDRGIFWSAAAVSFMVRNAGTGFEKYNNFKFSKRHSVYMHDSIKKQRAGDTNAPFWGFRLFQKRPEIGDIVGQWREQPSDFDDAAAGRDFPSHCDIIVSVRSDFVLAIGGNVKHSVSISRYEKTPGGFIDDNDGDTIILMVNQA
jgi:hypothetical protein